MFTSDLNRFQKLNGDFDIDWNLVASEVVTRALIGGYNVVAFSVFGWCEKMVALAGAELRQRVPDIFIMLGGASIFGSEEELRRRFPFADMFTLSYGEKMFANLRHYINLGTSRMMDLPRFGELESPYLSGVINAE